ncbi:MAG: P-type conjugative transfer ATPase TrbB [Marinicaulis sp.]|nr:P-type conjugative transfer ATPase TrbB [Marinicaulis sp.]NNL88799.1 P-type conjugative transfer ATPase TrbB [Marinicaulis sp.]
MLRTAFGDSIIAALSDPSVVEVMVNPDGALWIERHGGGRERTLTQLAEHETERVIRLVASHIGFSCDADHPIVSAELPETGERFEGVMPPISEAPCFSIRKPAGKLYRLKDYVLSGVLHESQADILCSTLQARKNILIAGGTGSGKTTLANALLSEIAASGERIILIEDTRELSCDATDCIALRTRDGIASLGDLVRSTLRLRPDRIIVGEVRGGEALDMLKAWNTGHPGGVATVHANSAAAALTRLEQLIGEAVVNAPRSLIAEAIDIVVYIAGRGNERRVEAIAEVVGLAGDQFSIRNFKPSENFEERKAS